MELLKICLFLYLILTIMLPTQLLGDEELEKRIAEWDARDAAKEEAYRGWECLGMTIVGVGIAMIWDTPSPDPAAFAGKSPEYVKAYTDEYKSQVKSRRVGYSILGCIGTLSIGGCVLVIIEINEAVNNCSTPSSSCDGSY